MAKFLAWLFASASLAIVVGFVFISLGVTVPPAYYPWTPLNPRDEPNVLTRYKLTRLERNAAECTIVLRQADIRQATVPDKVTGEGCGFEKAVRVSLAGAGDGFVATCPFAVAWWMFDSHACNRRPGGISARALPR